MKKIGWFLPLLILVGCDAAGYGLWLFTPREKKTIPAEYLGLKNHSLAVIFYVDEKAQLDYPNVRLTLGAKVVEQLRAHVKGLRVVAPLAVARYQDEHLHWDTQDKNTTAKDLKVDHLLIVSLVEFSTRVPGQMNAYQAQILAEANLYDASLDEGENRVWDSKDDSLEVVFPAQPQYNPQAEPIIRRRAEEQFVDQLAKKFYTHKIVVEPEN